MKNILLLLLSVFLFSSCEETFEEPSTAVQADKMSVSIGETVKFSFSNDPNFITFYSGEPGKNYKKKDKIYAEDCTLQLSFDSFGQWGGSPQYMSLWMSKNFIGTDSVAKINTLVNAFTTRKSDSLSRPLFNLTEAEINDKLEVLVTSFKAENNYKSSREYFDEALWEEIPDVEVGPDGTPSDAINVIVDLAPYSTDDATKVSVAFRNYAAWTFANFYINNYKAQVISDDFEGPKDVRDISDGWLSISVSNERRTWTSWSNGIRCFKGQPWNVPEVMDTWAIMFPLDLTQTDYPIAGDKGFNISPFVSTLNEYEYTYTEAGVYEATFVFTNADDKGNTKTTTQTIQIEVTE